MDIYEKCYMILHVNQSVNLLLYHTYNCNLMCVNKLAMATVMVPLEKCYARCELSEMSFMTLMRSD